MGQVHAFYSSPLLSIHPGPIRNTLCSLEGMCLIDLGNLLKGSELPNTTNLKTALQHVGLSKTLKPYLNHCKALKKISQGRKYCIDGKLPEDATCKKMAFIVGGGEYNFHLNHDH